MPYPKFLPLVWAGIWRKRGRAVLMLLQIASAFALFGLLEGLNTGIKQAIAETHRDRLYVGSSVSLGDPLPISVLGRIRATPGVAFATPRQALPGTYQQPDQQVGVIAVDPEAYFAIFDELSATARRGRRAREQPHRHSRGQRHDGAVRLEGRRARRSPIAGA